MTEPSDFWIEQTPGSLIRPYTLTRGRTAEPKHNLDMITMVVAAELSPRPERLDAEHAEVLRMCAVPHSIAELSAALAQPLIATKILISDLIESGHLIYRVPTPITQELDIDVAKAVLAKLRAL